LQLELKNETYLLTKIYLFMKKSLFILGLFLLVAFLHAQNYSSAIVKQSALLEEPTETQEDFRAECLSAKNLQVVYTPNCDAELTWNPPAELLWDNTGTRSNYGGVSIYLAFESAPRWIMADDFDLPVGESWLISEVYFSGFFKTSSGDFEKPVCFGIEIYNDNGANLPGNEIYKNISLIPVGGSTAAAYPTVSLPEPLLLDVPGKYWISIYGVYFASWDLEQYRYLVHYDDVPKGADICRWDQYNGGAWESGGESYPSIYFRLNGSKSLDPVKYNVYRDQQLIASNLTERKYSDTGFDYTKAHAWSVRTVCPDTVSTSVNSTMPKCQPQGVIENSTVSFSISPNPSTDNIKITAESDFNRVELINFLGQTLISLPTTRREVNLNVSNLNNGIYFVRVTTNSGSSVQKFVKK